ncbi:hypothetical protein [Providencia sp. PROV260]|uniref:hypothetical protein n=1 Tax=Providencia sp. PROV260 TaxID=2949948 RepID=UPI002349EAC4|nr:hypothetical protein [Providencia sp. PROV260]
MIVLSDNDVILKLAQCDLLQYLPDILSENPNDIYVSPTAKFQLLPKSPEKAIRKCGTKEIYERVERFLNDVRIIDEIKNEQLLRELEEIPHIDIGEQQLLASCVEKPESLFMTGDKRCLKAVMEHQNIVATVHARLINSVVTFESALLLSVELLGFSNFLTQIKHNPKMDGMLNLAMRSTEHEQVCECLFSYTRDFYDYLAFKERLPAQNADRLM